MQCLEFDAIGSGESHYIGTEGMFHTISYAKSGCLLMQFVK